MDKNLYLFVANIIQASVALLIGKFLHGRRVFVIYIILGLTALTELFFVIYESIRGKNE